MNLVAILWLAGCFAVVVNNASASWTRPFRVAGSAVERFATHPETLKWGFYAFMVAWSVTDALRDSDVHKDHYLHSDHTKYLTGPDAASGWHTIKNFNRLFGALAGGSLGGAYFKGHIDFRATANRGLNGAAMSYLPWRAFYLKNKHDFWYSNRAKFNKHLLPWFTPYDLKDRYIALSGYQVDIFYTVLTGFGATRAVFFDPAETE